MKKCLIFLSLIIGAYLNLKSQAFNRGESAQMYWTYRPDIGTNCYEFTYESYLTRNGSSIPDYHSNGINMYYWNDCNYGKTWIGASDTGFVNEPLHITLARSVNPYGIIDTFCGFDMPYNTASESPVDDDLLDSPHKKMLQYKGIVCLPEKCNQWHFAIGAYKYVCIDASDKAGIFANIVTSSDTFVLSNIDNLCYSPYFGSMTNSSGGWGVVGCSFNNTNYPDNSSARFLSPPAYYFSIGKEAEYNPGPYDPDHDSISITIVDTMKTTLMLLTWPPGVRNSFKVNDTAGNPYPDVFTYNIFFAPLPGQTGPNPIRYNAVNNPFDTDSTFHIIDSTGEVTFTGQSVMYPILYYRARDYRNHQLVSESYFYNSFSMLDDPRPLSYMNVDSAGLQNANFNTQGTMVGCPAWPISFDAYIKLPGVTNGDLKVRTTADTTLPGNAICAITNPNTDSVHLHFNWTPPVGSHGLYSVFVSAKDSNCSPPYNHFMQVYTWNFYIDSCSATMAVNDLENDNSLILYPNPATNKVSITSSKEFRSVKVYNLLSELVMEENVKPSKEIELDVSGLPSGIYLVNVDGVVRKMVVESR